MTRPYRRRRTLHTVLLLATSSLLLNGLGRLEEMHDDLRGWMAQHRYSTLDAFRGKMSQGKSANPGAYERVQFMRRSLGSGA